VKNTLSLSTKNNTELETLLNSTRTNHISTVAKLTEDMSALKENLSVSEKKVNLLENKISSEENIQEIMSFKEKLQQADFMVTGLEKQDKKNSSGLIPVSDNISTELKRSRPKSRVDEDKENNNLERLNNEISSLKNKLL